MDNVLLLAALKTDLGISSAVFDERLTARLESSREEIRREGITLLDTAEDRDLLVMHAAWKWRSRVTGEGMPRMLRWLMNNRIFSEEAM